jgi:hypothetical protein
MNHPEPELFLEAVKKMEIRVREANRRRLELLVFHRGSLSQPTMVRSLPIGNKKKE